MTPKPRASNPEGLPPCVYKKHGAYWLVKRGTWTKLGNARGKALLEYAKLTAPATGGAMGKLIDEAMVEILSRVKESTGEQYKVAARQLKEALVEFEPQQVTMADVAEVKRDYRGRPRAGNQALSVLRMVFLYAVESGICTTNPCIGIPLYPVGKRDRLIAWSEFHAIRAKAPPMLQAFMDLLVTTGQRPSDVLKIRRADIEDGEGIYFRQTKTGAKLRVKWTPDIGAAVEAAKALPGRTGSLTLFRMPDGSLPRYAAVYDAWLRACADAGVKDAQLRDLRALSGTETKRQGKNPQALLGHTSQAMTERYLRDREVPEVEGPVIRGRGVLLDMSNTPAKKRLKSK